MSDYIVTPKGRGTTVLPTQATLDAVTVIRALQLRITGLETQLAEATEQLDTLDSHAAACHQAIRFISALKPGMAIDVADPLAMMVEVHAHVTRERSQRDAAPPVCPPTIVGNNATHVRALTIRRREEP